MKYIPSFGLVWWYFSEFFPCMLYTYRVIYSHKLVNISNLNACPNEGLLGSESSYNEWLGLVISFGIVRLNAFSILFFFHKPTYNLISEIEGIAFLWLLLSWLMSKKISSYILLLSPSISPPSYCFTYFFFLFWRISWILFLF